MYGKIFKQIYDSTLADDWRALVTFQQLIILCDEDGVVDMTPSAIHRVTNIPLDIIEPGLEILQRPDKCSRSSAEEGRRIVLLDDDRVWGWRIVNHTYYRNLASREDKKTKDRARIADKREKAKENKDVAECREESQKVANVAHTDTYTNTDTEAKTKPAHARDPLPEADMPPGLDQAAWAQWVDYRKQLRKPLKPVSMPATQRKLAAFGSDQAAVVEQSIANGWLGLFALKPGGNHETHQRIDNSAPARVRRAYEEADRKRGRIIDPD